MNIFKKLFLKFNATDAATVVFYSLLIIVNLLFFSRVIHWKELVIVEIIVISFVVTVNYKLLSKQTAILKFLHFWYPAALIFLTYKQLYFMIRPIRINDYDQLLIQIDRFIFQTDPTKALYAIANPFLTEILQIVYFSFYLLPILLALFLFIEGKRSETDYAVFAVVYGFFVSYVGYFLLPGIGPRFTLHNFNMTDVELNGFLLAVPLRHLINAGGSVNLGGSITDSFQRDVFPSGHTMITLIVMYLSVKLKCKIKAALIIAGILLIFSTVYLRYHYGVDVIAGTLFAVFSLWSGKKIYNRWQKYTLNNPIKY